MRRRGMTERTNMRFANPDCPSLISEGSELSNHMRTCLYVPLSLRWWKTTVFIFGAHTAAPAGIIADTHLCRMAIAGRQGKACYVPLYCLLSTWGQRRCRSREA